MLLWIGYGLVLMFAVTLSVTSNTSSVLVYSYLLSLGFHKKLFSDSVCAVIVCWTTIVITPENFIGVMVICGVGGEFSNSMIKSHSFSGSEL